VGLLAAGTRWSQQEPATVAAAGESPQVAAEPAAAAASAATAPAPAEPAEAVGPLTVAHTASAAPAPPPAPPTLLRDVNDAWRELAQAWKLPVPEGAPCETLAQQGVHCFSKNMSLALVRLLGRPGIVTLDADSGQPSYAILTTLTDTTATLRAAGTEQTVTLAALGRRWQGDFATLWRAPQGYRDGLRDGQDGPVVDWVAERLAAATGAAARPAKARLDARMRTEVRAFQVAQGLPADGQPGPLTYMQLNRASGVDEPRLRTQP
jgi:general secretion pathway protein A